jgi:predicted Zn-dependent peptidase
MNIKEIIGQAVGEKYYEVSHSSGLKILVWEMLGFSSVEAIYGTKYGSINTRFKLSSDKEFTEVPEGIAHFLEHKLFENEDSDVFELFAKTGASANAYTSFDRTCYLFSAASNITESLEILLDFVGAPYFTAQSVLKEQGIIGQEIQMCRDNPNWRVFFNLLGAMYKAHPVKIDIAGTPESIAKIDADLLYKCYNTFYNLHNMVLVVAGNVKLDEVIAAADKCLKPTENQGLETDFPFEPDDVVQEEVLQILPVGVPMFMVGIKCKPLDGYAGLRAEIEAEVCANVLADQSSVLYKKMLSEKLINTSFSTEIFTGGGYFSIMFSGESEQPQKVLASIREEIEKLKVEGLDRTHYEAVKKATYGLLVRESNNVEAVAGALISAYFQGNTAFDAMRVLSEMTYEDVQKCLCERFDTSKMALSIVKSE